MAEEVKLYGNRGSPFSVRIDIALKLKGVEYTYYGEDLQNKSDSLIKYNPIHKKVPVFVHNEKPIPESLVILEYIDETWKSGPPILPQDPYERAQARFWARFIDDKVMPTLLKAFKNKEEREKASEEAAGLLQILEKELKHKYFGGESIGLVDIAAVFIAPWVPALQQLFGVEIFTEEKYPKLWQWSHDFVNHDLVKEFLTPKENLIAYLKTRFQITN